MVSFTLDAVKFLLIYRYLQNIYWFKYGKRKAQLILDEKVEIGFTKQMCIEAWGEPQDINRTITRNRVHEQWVYGIGCYLYFEGNFLTAIQN